MDEKQIDNSQAGQCFCSGVGPQLTSMGESAVRSVMPGAAIEHFKASHVEFLKGLRHLLDARIQRMSTAKTHGTSIPVE